MYFYELIGKCDPARLTGEFLALCTGSPDIKQTEKDFGYFYDSLKDIVPNTDDNVKLIIEHVEEDADTPFDAVHSITAGDPQKYSIIADYWANTLGSAVDEESLTRYGAEKFTALVMWEMTYLGFSEERVRARVDSWERAGFDDDDD